MARWRWRWLGGGGDGLLEVKVEQKKKVPILDRMEVTKRCKEEKEQ
jgi:hypothetical protein